MPFAGGETAIGVFVKNGKHLDEMLGKEREGLRPAGTDRDH